MSDFKPDDVVAHPKYGRGIVQQQDGGMLRIEWSRSYNWTYLPRAGHDLRRLAAIDPEDRKQVERLARLMADTGVALDWDARTPANQQWTIDGLAAALREFANPKPPKPEEPTGLGAVVEDSEGRKWVRIESRTGWWWRSNRTGRTLRWPDVDAVRKLSEGVEVES